MKKQIFTRTAIALLIGGFGVSMSAMGAGVLDIAKEAKNKAEAVEKRVVTVETVLGIDPTSTDPNTVKPTLLDDLKERVTKLETNSGSQIGNGLYGDNVEINKDGSFSLKDDPDKDKSERQFNLGTIVKDLDDTNTVLEDTLNKADNNEARLNEIDDDLDDMDKDIDSNTTRIKANEDQIAAINERHDKVDAAKRAALEKAINHNADEITTLGNQYAVLGALHNTEEAQIQDLVAHRALQDVQIHNLDTRLNQLDTRLNRLDKKLKRGLASQAALSGLFQPYTVGKFNATAAVGGYNSQQAVAVGAGYRFNDHVAGKAGVAFAGHGDVSYHAGVNFEW